MIKKILSHIKTRGIKRSFEQSLAIAEDFIFDKKNSLDTVKPRQLDSLKIDSPNKYQGVDYRPTKARVFRKLMHILMLPPKSVLVDFGCGKGKVLLMASNYHFKRILGIEFSRELCDIARKNIQLFRKNAPANIEILELDCVEYEIKDDENIFFFFNPFEVKVIKSIVNNICDSLRKKQRKAWIIYNNPLYCDIIEERRDVFSKLTEYVYGYSKVIVYVNHYS